MEPAFSVHAEPGVDLRNAMVIVGCAGIGLVGATTAKHIVSQLEMRCIGSVQPRHVPPAAVVRGGRSSSPNRIYHARGVSVLQPRADQIVVIEIERPISAAEEQPLADAIVRWAKAAGAGVVIIPGGIAVDDEALDDKVWGAASSAYGLETLQAMKVETFDGVIGGLAAGLLTAGEQEDLHVICFLAEAAPGYPDAHAAARIVALLDSMSFSFVISHTPLVEQAERVEKEIRASMDLLGAARGHTGARRPTG